MPAYRGLVRENREFFVVFQNNSNRWPLSRWLEPGFRHCWLYWPVYLGPKGLLTRKITLKLEMNVSFLHADTWMADPNIITQEFLPISTDILRITLPFNGIMRYSPRGLISCVSLVKVAMNIKDWSIVTPMQLHRYLLKSGATSLKEITNGKRYHRTVSTAEGTGAEPAIGGSAG